MEKENIVVKGKSNSLKASSPLTNEVKKEINKKEEKNMDVLEKIREEERAKLEALKEKEQEKTRLAIEKERTRLEAELAKEIKDLESQLNRAKNASQKVKARTPISTDIPSIVVEDAIEIDDNSEVIQEVITTTPKKETTKKVKVVEVQVDEDAEEEVEVPVFKDAPITKSSPTNKVTTTKKPVVKTAAQKEREKEKARIAKEKEKEKARLAKEKEKEKEKARLAKEKEKEKEKFRLEKKKERELEKAKLEKEKEIEEAKLAEEKQKEAIVLAEKVKKEALIRAEQQAKQEALIKAEEEAAIKAEQEAIRVAKEAEQEAKRLAEEQKAIDLSKEQETKEAEIADEKDTNEVNKLEESKETEVVDNIVEDNKEEKDFKVVIPVIEKKFAETKPIFKEEIPSSKSDILTKVSDVKPSKPNTAMTSLQKLREKIAAQKRLERELMEREAQRVQEKEKTLQEKFLSLQRIVEEEENIVTLEELEQERINVDGLRREKEDLEEYLENLQTIIDRVVDLRVDGVKVIDSDTWELTEEFQSLGIDSNALNRTVLEIEEEVDALSKSHEDYINKIIKAEENYKTLEALYLQQEKLIADLNKQVTSLREQVAKEKVLNRQYSSQLERLRSEKNRLEKSYKYSKPADYSGEVEDEEIHGVLGELERLNEEVRKLISKDHSKKVSKEIEEKDLEIETLKQQLEEMKSKPFKDPQLPQNQYYANGANMFIPGGYPYAPYIQPQPSVFDFYLSEVDKLRREIDGLKQTKMTEPIANPEVFTGKIAEVQGKAEIITEPIKKESIKQEQVKQEQVKEETQNKAEQLKIENELLEKNNESLNKIKELQKQILEKDKYIEKIKKEMSEYTEEDIFDPNFKRKIRVIRDKKAEITNRSAEEEQVYLDSTKETNNQMKVIKSNIDNIKDRLFDLDMNYRQNRDYSSAAKDEYEKAKGKALVELQLQEEKLNNYNQDIVRARQKYDRVLSSKEIEMEKLNQEEVETIQFYLNKMVQGNKITNKLRTTEEEKQNLVDELDQLRSDNNSVVTEIDAYDGEERKKLLTHKANSLETEIRDQTRQYNVYYEKITDLKNELVKRQELESNLKQNDDEVFDYTSTIQSLEDCENDFNQKNERIAMLQLEIEGNSSDKEVMLRKKAEISDLLVHREDLKTKMDFFKVKIAELEVKSNIITYKKINNQINQIKKVSKDHRLAAETIKAEVQDKTNQLEKIKNELKGL